MKVINNLIKFAVAGSLFSVIFSISGCSYSIKDEKLLDEKINVFAKAHKKASVVTKKPTIKHEKELFNRKVSATFYNESLKTVLPTLVKKIQYSPGVDNNVAVSLEVNGVSIYKALHKVLKPIGLSYIRTTGGILVIKQKRITFRAFNQPLDIVLNAMLGDISYIVKDGADKSLKESVSVEFKDLPIEMALDRVLSQLELQWKKEAKSYIVFRDKEETFLINFPLIEQSFNVSSSRNEENNNKKKKNKSGGNSGISFSSSKARSSGATASLKNLTKTIEKFLTDDGKVVIHRELGMIWVKDKANVVDRIGEFLAKVNINISHSVHITGVITEVSLSRNNKIGIDWASVASSVVAQGAQVTSASNFGAVGGANEANFVLNWKGANGRIDTAYINALKKFGDVRVISRPSLRVSNNAIGSLTVGKNTSYVAEVESTASSSSPTTYASKMKSLQTGLNFYVLPHVISNTDAVIYISPELTSLEDIRLVSTGSASPSVEAPEISIRQTQTVVPIKNGESIVIGGLMAETDKKVNKKTPLLGDIPLIGALFQSEETRKGVTEFSLMINVTW